MAADNRPTRLPALFVAAVMVILVVGIGTVAAAVHNAAGPGSPLAVPTPIPTAVPTAAQSPASSASATPSATAVASLAPPPDRCAASTFSAPLAPLSPPPDPHVYTAPPAIRIDPARLYEATITSTQGTIVICLDPQLAPVSVNNFVTLARNHFYDGLVWHRVVAGFVIQGGDPKGDGSGGPGYTFKDEQVKATYAVGAVAMANSGPDTNGSQFFICTGAQCPPLPPKYNLFGTVVSGQDVATATRQGDVMRTITVSESQ